MTDENKAGMPDRIWAFGDKLDGFHSGMWRDENILDGIHNVEYLRSDLAAEREKIRELLNLIKCEAQLMGSKSFDSESYNQRNRLFQRLLKELGLGGSDE